MSTMDTNFALDMEREERRAAGCPWRRYFARYFDFALYSLLWSLAAQWGLRLNIGEWNVMLKVLSTIVGAVLMVVIEPFLLHFWGTTPGKWLFGMEIRTPNGEKLAIRTGFYRTWQVFTGGMGWDIPIWSWYRLYKSYQASTAGELPWDIDNGCHIVMHERKTKWYRVLMFLFAWLLVLTAEFGISLYADLPHNRGRMTLSQYVDNCNDMQRYHQWGRIVRPDGTLSDDSSTQGQFITIETKQGEILTPENAREEQPVCTVETDADGYVTAVEMHVEMDVEAVGYVPGTDVKTMMLYAYGLPHEKLSLLSLSRDILSDRDSYTRNLGSLTVTQKIEMKGLEWLGPDNGEDNFLVQTNENAKDAHFALTFRIEET